MLENRLKTMRKVKRKTQAEIAQVVGITQNTYSYWENGKVKIDNDSLRRLADYYNVTLDFLAGRKYRVTKPASEWRSDLREDYEHGDSFLRQYLEYCYGDIVYIDGTSSSVSIQNSVIGDNNSGCCNGAKTGSLEEMLLHFFNKLTVEKKFEVLEFAKKLNKENEE